MNKNDFKMLVWIILAMVLVVGCAQKQPAAVPETSAPAISSEAPGEGNTEQANAEAEQAYMAFLNGEGSVTTSEKFREDDGEYNEDGLLYGTYSYEELKDAIAAFEGHDSATKYALVDFGQDGVNELAIRFDNVDPSFLNWVGVIKYNGEGLELNDSYEDGYRSFSTLYTSGYLQEGGSMGAGAHVSTLVGFDENGVGTDIFSVRSYLGTFVEGVAYDLQMDGPGLSGNYDDIAGTSALEVTEYMADGVAKLSVSGWSADPSVREREKALVEELEGMGAEIISEEEMTAICSLSPYEAPEVTWNVWDDGENVDDGANGEIGGEALISAYFPDEALLAQPQAFTEFIADDSEYQVKVVFSTDLPVTNVCVLSLFIDDMTEDGRLICSETELYTQEKLTPEKPLVVGMAFPGDLPSMGISYVDADGAQRVLAITLSGYDGSPELSEVALS